MADDSIRPPWWLKPMHKVFTTIPTLGLPVGAKARTRGYRLGAAALMISSGLLNAAPAQANPMCTSDPMPAGAASRPFDGGTLWISNDGLIGIPTPDGTGTLRVPTAAPTPLEAVVVDAENNGQQQLIVSDGRSAHLYILIHCWISETYDSQGEPFIFDLQSLRGRGTGAGCQDLGDGRHLVALQALPDGGGYVVNRTAIRMEGTTALRGPSDSIPGTSLQDPVVAAAMTITCGSQSIGADGVRQP